MAVENLKKVKILVLGDTGVGKTSLASLVCHKEVLSNPSWTVGCAVDVKFHDYGRTVSSTCSYFIEVWDIGGSPAHSKGRPIFYHQANVVPFHPRRLQGIILVHDLTNRKSHGNLSKWLAEYHRSKVGDGHRSSRSSGFNDSKSDVLLEYDPERFADDDIPILIVGTKLDQATSVKLPSSTNVAGAMCINVDCTSARHFAVDSKQTIEINKFFDKVIERRFFPSYHMVSPVHGGERHRVIGKRT